MAIAGQITDDLKDCFRATSADVNGALGWCPWKAATARENLYGQGAVGVLGAGKLRPGSICTMIEAGYTSRMWFSDISAGNIKGTGPMLFG